MSTPRTIQDPKRFAFIIGLVFSGFLHLSANAGPVDFDHLSITPAKTCDLGVMTSDSFSIREIEFPNNGDKKIEIASLTPECREISIYEYSNTVAPKQKGVVKFMFVPEKKGLLESMLEMKLKNGEKRYFKVLARVVDDKNDLNELNRRRVKRRVNLYDELSIAPDALELEMEKTPDMVKNLVFIDLRKKKRSVNSSLPGSIKMKLHEIKRKEWLKNKRVVLVHDLSDQKRVLNECRKLRQSGWNVSILRRGFGVGGKRVGVPDPNSLRVNEITPMELYYSFSDAKWLALSVTSSKQKSNIKNNLLAALETMELPFSRKQGELVENWKKLFESKNTVDKNKRLLVHSPNGSNYIPVNRALRQIDDREIFYLKGGVAAFNQFADKFLSQKKVQIKSLETKCGCGKK